MAATRSPWKYVVAVGLALIVSSAAVSASGQDGAERVFVRGHKLIQSRAARSTVLAAKGQYEACRAGKRRCFAFFSGDRLIVYRTRENGAVVNWIEVGGDDVARATCVERGRE